MNIYVAFCRGKKTTVEAMSSLEAQTKAANEFKAKKRYGVSVVLATTNIQDGNGTPVVHQPQWVVG